MKIPVYSFPYKRNTDRQNGPGKSNFIRATDKNRIAVAIYGLEPPNRSNKQHSDTVGCT